MIGSFVGHAIGAVPLTRTAAEELPPENTGGRAPLTIPKDGDIPASRWRGEPPR